MLPSTLLTYVSQFLSFLQPKQTSPQNELSLSLRHYHTVSPKGRILFADQLGPTSLTSNSTGHRLKTRRLKRQRPVSPTAYQQARVRSAKYGQSSVLDWDEDEIDGPDTESRHTLLELAKMTSNAYISPEDPQWYELDGQWSVDYPFGWDAEENGFRGYVFATADNSTVVMTIKGTSAGIFTGGPTGAKDKKNDNLLFSCCCGRVDITWSTVCSCFSGGWKCDQPCLEKSLIDESLFYPSGTNLYNNLTYIYPHANIWIIGHSLGGALASLLGVTFGAPVVSFESPGAQLAASRLHLPSPPSVVEHVTHVYNTADTIAMGSCTGVLSACYIGGFAMESRCHIGKSIIYDTVTNLSWSAGVTSHPIVTVIDKILSQPWNHSESLGREVPAPVTDDECVDCYQWDYGEYK